ncbi:MBL fold metallo-hydrolase [Ammoniphilus sp. YIM 78166]|uniref:MBL fold metallo-hydrolase n=1 Tax=Ammoniphilus sp. YIM 78166 TaxID=1644106 RepID=UPI0010704DDE|nr:MBL fold metallo-hydrolase [Ammoniphilus sp. YIM 78166]
MLIQKLPWAGILVKDDETTIVIDPLYHVNTKFFGEPLEEFYPLDDFYKPEAVFVTHLHSDHFDPKGIEQFYGKSIPVYVPKEDNHATPITPLHNVQGVGEGTTVKIGKMSITSTYSVDGLGDQQVAWIVEAEGKKLIHCGDTLWHGYWWKICEKFGPFDVACLPINGAILSVSELTPSGQPICLTPEQAVSAAVILKAKALIPIHYGAFHSPPNYSQTENATERLISSALSNQIHPVLLKTKEWYEV